jgi:peroxiredoxin
MTLPISMMRILKLSSLMLGLALSTDAFAIKEGDMMPSVSIKGADGKSTLDWKGKVTVLNFWATWCDACKVELKEMNLEFKPLFERPDVVVAFVSLDKETQKARKYMEETFGPNGVITQRIAFDEAFEAADRLEVDSFPLTIVLDRSGKVIKIQRGFKEGEASTKALLDAAKSL